LAIVKSVVSLHGESVSAESRGLGDGSTFSCACLWRIAWQQKPQRATQESNK
jgi:hypothetical protein